MAITGSPERSYYDSYDRRTFYTVEAIERWLTDCKKRRARYAGKYIRTWNGTFEVVDMVFTEPGLIGWILYKDGDEIRKISEGQMTLEIVD